MANKETVNGQGLTFGDLLYGYTELTKKRDAHRRELDVLSACTYNVSEATAKKITLIMVEIAYEIANLDTLIEEHENTPIIKWKCKS